MKILIVAAFHAQEGTEESNFSFKQLESSFQTINTAETETVSTKPSEETFAGVPFVK